MNKITLKEVMAKQPCFNPTSRADLGADASLSEIMDYSQLSIRERLWVVERFLDEKWRRLYMIRCARNAIDKVIEESVDALTTNALTVAERFAHDKATKDEIFVARQQAWESVRGMKTVEGKLAIMMAARACGISGENQLVSNLLQDDQFKIMREVLKEAGIT